MIQHEQIMKTINHYHNMQYQVSPMHLTQENCQNPIFLLFGPFLAITITITTSIFFPFLKTNLMLKAKEIQRLLYLRKNGNERASTHTIPTK